MKARKDMNTLTLAAGLRAVQVERPSHERIVLTLPNGEQVTTRSVAAAIDYIRANAMPLVHFGKPVRQ